MQSSTSPGRLTDVSLTVDQSAGESFMRIILEVPMSGENQSKLQSIATWSRERGPLIADVELKVHDSHS